jgi:hypothetical protein
MGSRTRFPDYVCPVHTYAGNKPWLHERSRVPRVACRHSLSPILFLAM